MNESEANVEDLCRLCGKEMDIMLDIFKSDTNYADIIFKVIPIKIKEDDLLPKKICNLCEFKITDFDEFKTCCLKVQDHLKEIILSPMCNKNSDSVASEPISPPVSELRSNIEEPAEVEETKKSEESSIEKTDQTQSHNSQEPLPESQEKASPVNEPEDGEEISAPINETEEQNSENLESDERCPPLRRPSSPEDEASPHANEDSMSGSSSCDEPPDKKMKLTLKLKKSEGSNESWLLRNCDRDTDSPDEEEEKEEIESHADNGENEVVKENNNEIPKENELSEVKSGPVSSMNSSTVPSHLIKTNIPLAGTVYTCLHCVQTFVSQATAYAHTCAKMMGNGDSADEESPEPTPNSIYICEICDLTFSRHASLLAHRQSVHLQSSSSSESEEDDNYDENRVFFGQKRKKKVKPIKVIKDAEGNYL